MAGQLIFLTMECKHKVFLVLIISISVRQLIIADSLNLSNLTVVDGSFYANTNMRALIGAEPPTTFSVLKATFAEFPALSGHSVSYAVIQYPAGTINPPHTHPCSSELMFLLTGTLIVGFIDDNNRLYVKTLQAGDMFVFPKGLVHYQYNGNNKESSFAISAFASANAGTLSVPGDVFTAGLGDDVLSMAFKADFPTVQKIKASLASTA